MEKEIQTEMGAKLLQYATLGFNHTVRELVSESILGIESEMREKIALEMEDYINPQLARSEGEWEKGYYRAQLVMVEHVRGEKEEE
jgi:hypothetical protein